MRKRAKQWECLQEGDGTRQTCGSTHVFEMLAGAMEALGDDRFGTRLADLLQAVGQYESTVVAAFPEAGPPIRLFSNLAPEDEESTVRPYFDKTYLLDPWYNIARCTGSEGVHRLSECVPDSFAETEYYLEYYSKTCLIDECGLFVRLSEKVCIVTMLGNRTAHDAKVDNLRIIFPCIEQLVRKHWAGLSSIPVTSVENLSEICRRQGLVGREIEVTSHLLRGYSNKVIGRELGISPETVKVYRKRINRKLGTTSAREVFALFFGSGALNNPVQ